MSSAMENENNCKEVVDRDRWLAKFSFKKLCWITVYLPMTSLLICFVTANIFQQDDIHETHCKVYNVIPSISAITGISPQRYLWRICVALHIGPRLLVAMLYNQHYSALLKRNANNKGRWVLNLSFTFSIIEILTLCGVTYISNRENYPVHEKIFITFMISSLLYMLTFLKVFDMAHKSKSEREQYSYKLKKLFFAASILSTVGLFIFFVKHRFLCHIMAFSWFATCEYLIAFFNMAFHATVVIDFPTEQIIIGRGQEVPSLVGNGTTGHNKSWKSE